VTVLVSTHYMDEAEYCDRVALINQGRLIAIGSPEEIKHIPLAGQLLLIECDALGPTLAALQQAPGVRDCSVFGDSLHVLVEDAAVASVELPRYLQAKGLPLRRITSIEPSLEDVFVQLVGADTFNRKQAA
jgi:ABC-2 type transport system ATP-binding protein